jgi:tetratricopeptide (TPR) repeat protein
MEFIKEIIELLNKKKYEECLSKCEKKLQIEPDNSIAMFGITYCLFLKGDHKKSIEFADKNKLKIRERDLLVLIQMIEVYNLVSMNKFNEDMKILLDKLKKEKKEISNSAKFFLVLYHIFNSELNSAKDNYEELDLEKKKEIMRFLLKDSVKGKTAEIIRKEMNL